MTIEKKYQYYQWSLTAIFSLVTAVVIVIYTVLIMSSQRLARQKLEYSIGSVQNPMTKVQVPLPPPQTTYGEGANREPSIRSVMSLSFRDYERYVRRNLIVFDVFVWIVMSVISYFVLGALLKKAKRQAQAEEDFLANASHELKTPITTIKTELNVLENERDRKKIDESLEIIANENQNLQNLVEKLLLNNVKRANVLVRVKVEKLIKEKLQIYQKNFRAKKLQFELETEEKAVIVTDQEKLSAVIDLLLDNAGKYSEAETTVKVALTHEERTLVIRVINRGIGVAQVNQVEIFKRFYRVPDKKVSQEIGSGLGLAIAKSLMEELGGKLELESGAPTQTCFKLLLKNPEQKN